MSKTYSLKGKVSREVAPVIAEELVKELPDTQIVCRNGGASHTTCAKAGQPRRAGGGEVMNPGRYGRRARRPVSVGAALGA
jgi:hypothetical protein